jgi:hypothetical protein
VRSSTSPVTALPFTVMDTRTVIAASFGSGVS